MLAAAVVAVAEGDLVVSSCWRCSPLPLCARSAFDRSHDRRTDASATGAARVGVRQFVGSIQRIARNPYIDRFAAVGRHLDWQRRKLLRDFPLELDLSESVLVATHGRCGVS